jgi:hypothetical protein
VNGTIDPEAPEYLNAARNSARLLFDKYGYYPTRLHKHAPYSLRRSLLSELEAEFPQAFDLTRRSRFRSKADVSVASFLSHHYGFVKRCAVYSSYKAELFKSSDPLSLWKLQRAISAEDRPKTICINESGAPSPSDRWRQKVIRLLSSEYPTPAQWERGQ